MPNVGLLELPDVCLCDVFRILSVQDQLQLARVNTRFRNLIVQHIWGRHLDFRKAHEVLSVRDYRHIFAIMSPHMEALKFGDPGATHEECWPSCSSAEKSLRPDEIPTPDLSFASQLFFPALKTLEIRNNNVTDADLERWRERCPNLETLAVCSKRMTGRYLVSQKLAPITQIDMPRYKLKTNSIPKIFRQLGVRKLELKALATNSDAEEADDLRLQLTGCLSEKIYDERVMRISMTPHEPEKEAWHCYQMLNYMGGALNEVGIFYEDVVPLIGRLMLNRSITILPRVRFLHFKAVHDEIWFYLLGCPLLTDIFFHYPGLCDIFEILDFLRGLYRESELFDVPQKGEKLIGIHFREMLLVNRIVLEHIFHGELYAKLKCTIYRDGRFFRFNYSFDVLPNERSHLFFQGGANRNFGYDC